MKIITVKIDGMMCGMCEAHICDTIRRAFPDAKKVSASRKSGEATFLYENSIDGEALKKAIAEIGYSFVSFSSEECRRRRLFGRYCYARGLFDRTDRQRSFGRRRDDRAQQDDKRSSDRPLS